MENTTTVRLSQKSRNRFKVNPFLTKFVHIAKRPWKSRPTAKRARTIHPKFFSRNCLQSYVQRRYFVAAISSKPISLPWLRRRSKTDIVNE